MASLLTYEMGNTDKVVEYIGECREMGIEVLGPDINESFSDFTVVYSEDYDHKNDPGLIRFGLAAVRGVGEKAVEQIIAAREKVGRFASLYNFCENVDLRAVNKHVIDALIKAGAFDKMGGSRAQMTAGMEKAVQVGSSMQSDARSGQMNFFGSKGFGGKEDFRSDHKELPNVPPWTEMQMLNYEKEMLGFYVSVNPLSKYAETIEVYSNVNTGGLDSKAEAQRVVIGGMVTSIRHMVTRKGRNAGAKMAVFTLEDLQGSCEVVMFSKVLRDFSDQLEVDRILFVEGRVDRRREKSGIICDELITLDQACDRLADKVFIRMDSRDVTEKQIYAYPRDLHHAQR